jgi:WD40 repeat protein
MSVLTRREMVGWTVGTIAALSQQRSTCALSPPFVTRIPHAFDVSLAPDGRTFVTADSDGGVRIWDRQTGSRVELLPGHYGGAIAVDVSPDGKLIASGGADKKCRLWETAKQAEKAVYYAENYVDFVSFTADGKWLLFSSARELQVVDLRDGKTQKLQKREGHGGFIAAVLLDGDTVAAGQGDGAVRIWKLSSGKLTIEIPGRVWPRALHYSARTRRLSVAFDDGSAYLWSMAKQRVVSRITMKPDDPQVLRWAEDGETLLAATNVRATEIWNVAEKRLIAKLDDPIGVTACGRFSKNSAWVVIGCDHGRVVILETRTGRLVKEFNLVEEYFDHPGPGSWEKNTPVSPLPLGRVF